jgi:hypothetical protein
MSSYSGLADHSLYLSDLEGTTATRDVELAIETFRYDIDRRTERRCPH